MFQYEKSVVGWARGGPTALAFGVDESLRRKESPVGQKAAAAHRNTVNIGQQTASSQSVDMNGSMWAVSVGGPFLVGQRSP